MVRAKQKMHAAAQANVGPDFDASGSGEATQRAATVPEQIQKLLELKQEGKITDEQYQAALNKVDS